MIKCRNAHIPPHPARYLSGIPEFFIRFLTEGKDDLVLDPFGGSNTTGAAAEKWEEDASVLKSFANICADQSSDSIRNSKRPLTFE
jgi:hypothetical protein